MKAKDYRDQSLEELESQVQDHRNELFNLVNQKKQTKKMEKPHLIGKIRKDVAKMLTVIREKQHQGTKESA